MTGYEHREDSQQMDGRNDPRLHRGTVKGMVYSANGADEKVFQNNLTRARACPEIHRFGISREHMCWLGDEIERLRAASSQPTPVAEEIDQEKFCIVFGWAYGTALERKCMKREPNDGLTPQALWDQSSNEDREFLRAVVRDTFSALGESGK